MIAMLWAKVRQWVYGIGAFLALLGAAWLLGRGKGKQVEQVNTRAAQDAAASAVAVVKQMESRHETDVAVERLPDAPPGVSIGDAPPDTAAGKLSDWAQ